ncbi:hypothetical protein ABMA28_003251 [Loxostege sticticalis]|uniref:Peptidase M14 domain-containing protein n=1 Tax=Loxostege sticticalis TaxID=481309 RepID=A0ABD0SVJ9_LOXSC
MGMAITVFTVHEIKPGDRQTDGQKDRQRSGNINWASNPKLPEIYNYLKSVAAADSNSCTLKSIGKTAHRKDIMMLKLSNGNPSNEAFLVEAGLHGREWAAVLSVLYFIEHIAWNFTKQPDYIKNKDWYIIPVVNPEGYEYSMTKNRLWRKNRRTFSGPCDGVDLNRNFDTNWGTRDSSNNICAETFCGPQPFSEQETIAIRGVTQGSVIGPKLYLHQMFNSAFKAYVTLHISRADYYNTNNNTETEVEITSYS